MVLSAAWGAGKPGPGVPGQGPRVSASTRGPGTPQPQGYNRGGLWCYSTCPVPTRAAPNPPPNLSYHSTSLPKKPGLIQDLPARQPTLKPFPPHLNYTFLEAPPTPKENLSCMKHSEISWAAELCHPHNRAVPGTGGPGTMGRTVWERLRGHGTARLAWPLHHSAAHSPRTTRPLCPRAAVAENMRGLPPKCPPRTTGLLPRARPPSASKSHPVCFAGGEQPGY